MLKRAISTSRRLADLKTDSARLLYTWIIPHLDIEGRFYADVSMIKGHIVPRLKTFTDSKIEECLQDMAESGLILLYVVDGDRYLQLRKFSDHQNLREKREAKSIIPSPPEATSSINTPGELPDNSRTMPAQDKIREDKIREDKRRAKNKTPLPPDFGISENVRRWAKQKGHYRLEEHLESFKAKCKANGYTYIDWDAAFQEAIRSNWAKIDTGNGNGNGRPKPTSPYHVCSRCGSEYLETDVLEYKGNMICPKCPEAKDMAKESFDRLSSLTKGIGSRAGP